MAMRMIPAFHPLLIFRRDRFGRGGDHTSFANEGFAAVRFTEWLENFNHQHQTPPVQNGIQNAHDIKYDDFKYIPNAPPPNPPPLPTPPPPPPHPPQTPLPH